MDRREFIGFPPPSPGMNYSSTSSINDSVTSDEIVSNRLKILMSMVKKQKKLFIGEYTARRLVQSIVPEYRDIVVVNKEEESLISCLKEIQKVISTEFGNEKWLGITSNLVEGKVEGYNLWVELNQVPFGKHWFQIRSLKIKDNTVQLQLKYIRPFQALKREYLNDENHPTFDLNKILTYKNICEAIKFTAVVLMSIFAVCGQLLWYLSDYSLKITRELSNLIRALTPVIFGFYELLAKCIGGIYWLIYMMFLGSNSRGGGPIVPPPPMAIMPNNNNRQSYGYRQNYNKKWK